MINDLETIGANVDDVINAGQSYLVDDPSALHELSLNNNISLKIISQNIRSVTKNLDDFGTFISRSKLEFDLIILSECWLQGCGSIPSLDQYCTFSTSRHINQNSGVIVYIRDNINDASAFEPDLDDADCLVVRIGKNHVFICVYRSPSFASTVNFLSSLDKLLISLKHVPNVYILGDINIDICINTVDNRSDEYLDLLALHGLLTSHVFPTRQDKCIDHCIIKSKTKVITAICKSSVTDHRCLYLAISSGSNQQISRAQNWMKIINYEKVVKLISDRNWEDILNLHDANETTENLVGIISNVIKSCTKSRPVPNRKLTLQPWVTPGLLRCMRFRDTLHQRHKKSPDDKPLELTYKRYRNHCNNILHNLKNAYDRAELHDANHDIKKTWKVIKRVCGYNTTNKKDNLDELIKLKSTPQDSTDHINDYFVNIGENLAATILQKLNLSQDELVQRFKPTDSQLHSFMLLETNLIEVNNIISSLKNTSSTGWDGISSLLLKKCIGILGPPITHLCNLCLTSGVFPTLLKESIVIPIFKSGDRDGITNYRPISLLSTLAKILEKLINTRLVNYLEANNLLAGNQYGFRAKKSTVDAIGNLVTQVADNLDKKQKCIGVFLDLAKAFDTVSVPLLLRKLESFGVRGVPLNLFKDYLSGRSQAVKMGDTFSSKKPISFGVPQGSVLGPTLFLIYINNLCQTTLTNAKITTFADDTVIVFNGSTWEDARMAAENGMRLIINWLNNNLLTLNLSKTKYVTFSIYKNSQPSTDFTLKAHTCSVDTNKNCDCYTLSATDSIKYLGITIDKNLNWKIQIDTLKSRIRKLIHIFKRIRQLRDETTNRTVYLTLCQSILTYGIQAWGGASKTSLIKLERSQRTILKVLNFKPFKYPTVDLYKETKVLTVRQLYIKLILLRQHAYPGRTDNLSDRRAHEVYKVPTCRTSFAHGFANFLGPLLYNRINKVIPLRQKSRFACRRALDEYLCQFDYEGTEKLLLLMK